MDALKIRQGSFYRYIANLTKIEHLRITFAYYSLLSDNLDKTPDELLDVFPHKKLINQQLEEHIFQSFILR